MNVFSNDQTLLNLLGDKTLLSIILFLLVRGVIEEEQYWW
jgi:hypothetical protein